MTIALTRKNKNNNTTPRYESSTAKKTSKTKTATLVPNFASRWHSFCKYFLTPEINNQRIQTEATTVYRDNPFTPYRKTPTYKKNPVKSIKISH